MELSPKEKAKELVNKYKPLCKDLKSIGILDGRAVYINDDILNNASAKQCTLITVDEIIKTYLEIDPKLTYQKEVKQELLKM